MAEVYTVSSVDDTTAQEITGGRVGWFKLKATSEDLRIGDSGVTNSTGFIIPLSAGFEFYVTSPDEIYVVSEGLTTNVLIYHNR